MTSRQRRSLDTFTILPQPDETSCGPTCLHAIYAYYQQPHDLNQLIQEVPTLKDGGTLAVWLACHALQTGFRATIYTYNLQIFDPSWFQQGHIDIANRLQLQRKYKRGYTLHQATEAYCQFLSLGGQLKFENLSRELLRHFLRKKVPILTGLSATYLYETPREYGPRNDYDDVRGDPSGHFVVLCGYQQASKEILVADPFRPNPSRSHKYHVFIDQLINAILLGILTYDANLLVIQPGRNAKKGS